MAGAREENQRSICRRKVFRKTAGCELMHTPELSSIEVLSAGPGLSLVYTESLALSDETRRSFTRCATYSRESGIYAWHFVVPSRVLPVVLSKLSGREHVLKMRRRPTLNTKDLQPLKNPNLTKARRWRRGPWGKVHPGRDGAPCGTPIR